MTNVTLMAYLAKCISIVMHDRAGVVRHTQVVNASLRLFLEVELHRRDYILPEDGDEAVAIFAGLFMPEACVKVEMRGKHIRVSGC